VSVTAAPRHVLLTRELTSTPLARRHERDVSDHATARGKTIAYASFDRSRYPLEALELAASAQQSLAIGEYMAVDLFAKLAAALALAGAPIDIVAAAARVPSDEIRHASLALKMARALSDADPPLPVDTGRHAYLAGPLTLGDLDLAMLEMPALGETLACALLGASRERADDPIVAAHFGALLRDEVHHARLGWYYLGWRAPAWTLEERQRVADHAGLFVMHTEAMFARGRDAPRGARRAAKALGVLDTRAQRAAIRSIMEREILPGLDGLGLGATHAWRARPRLSG
jgi:hypothetical protein